MNIDPEYVKEILQLIDDTLEAYKAANVEPNTVWGCENVGDFGIGFFVGVVTGKIICEFQHSQKRDPNGEEHAEIVALIQTRSKEIKEFFLKFNN